MNPNLRAVVLTPSHCACDKYSVDLSDSRDQHATTLRTIHKGLWAPPIPCAFVTIGLDWKITSTNHKDCCFKFRNQNLDTKVMRDESEDFFFLSFSTMTML